MDDPADVAGRVIEAVNAHDIGTLRGLYAADGRTRRPGWPDEGGPEALLASYEMDFACVPDIHFAPVSTLSDGPHVVTELRITGTNTGPTVRGDFGKALLGADGEEVRATGRSIDLPAVLVHQVRDEQVSPDRSLPADRSAQPLHLTVELAQPLTGRKGALGACAPARRTLR